MRKITRVILHCSASKNAKEWSIDEIRAEHINRGFSDIGYHFVIQPNGMICSGRKPEKEGAHCEGENYDSIGVCLIGLDKFTADQFTSLRILLSKLLGKYQLSLNSIYAHYEFSSAKKQGKTCPNMKIEEIISWYSSTDVTMISKYLIDL